MSDQAEYPEDIINSLAANIEQIIRILGDDPSREGMVKTPVRAAKALYYATRGYRSDVSEAVGDAFFTSTSSGIVIVRDIEFYSFCEHHLLPFFGHVSVGYLPGDKIIGLSKVARLVNLYAARFQTQEHLTSQIVEALSGVLAPKGVIAVCTGEHLCMKMRGVEKQSSSTTTMRASGVFQTSPELRMEFFSSLTRS